MYQEKLLQLLPKDVKELILNLAASNGLTKNDYNNTSRTCFIEGAIAMYLFQQNKINELEVEVDLLEGSVK